MNNLSNQTRLFACKLCGSTNIVRYGLYRGIQRWWCKDCRHKFADNNAAPDMKTPNNQVASAIDMYFSGTRISYIPEQLARRYGTYITSVSVYNWIMHFCRQAIHEANKAEINVGSTWIALETFTRNDMKDLNISLLDILDVETRFLLATKLSYSKSQYDVKSLIELASNRAKESPRELLTDGWKGYVDGVRLANGNSGRRIRINPICSLHSIDVAHSWYEATNTRNRIIRGMKKEDTLQVILDGWHIHYNYFGHQESLRGKTPADAARANFKYHSWQDIVQKSKPASEI
jgi:transposase-like protein